MLLLVLSAGLFIAVPDNHYWTVFPSVVWFGCTQAVARDPSKPLAEIMQDNCALWSPNRQFAVTGMEVAWHGVLLLWVWFAHWMCVCREEVIMCFSASGDQ